MPELPLVFAVIDDDPAIRRLLVAMVRAGGDVAVEASTLESGRIVLGEYPWDIAMIDRRMPDGDGLELCREISVRGSETHRHIVVVSARGEHDEKMTGFEAGVDDYIIKPVEPSELGARLRAIRRSVAAQKSLLARLSSLEKLSVVDGLTQVYNHRFFESELRRLFDLAQRHGRPLALAMVDIDHFKSVNDTHGHRAGDVVLTEVSTTIAQNVRSSDIVARYGGEEFALLLPETSAGDAALLAERVREAVESAVIEIPGCTLGVTISIGVAAVPIPGTDTPAQLIEDADRALYLAKSRGRNRVERHGPLADLERGAHAAALLS